MSDWKEDYNWREAFAYADAPKAMGDCDASSFTIDDVVDVHKMDEGENDELDWIIWGSLNDGRHFFLSAGCDYTGWDCQAGGDAWVATDKDRLVHSAMSIEHRRRFGLPSEGDRP